MAPICGMPPVSVTKPLIAPEKLTEDGARETAVRETHDPPLRGPPPDCAS